MSKFRLALIAVTLCFLRTTASKNINQEFPNVSQDLPTVEREENNTLIQPKDLEELINQPKNVGPLICGTHSLTVGQTYTIQSKNYPNLYPAVYTCDWKFKSTGATSISVTCSPFNVYKASLTCTGSYLSLIGGGLNKKYCGENTSLTAVSNANYLNVQFKSNSVRRKGFSCLIVPQGLSTTTTTTSTSTSTTTLTTTTTAPPCSSCGTINRANRIVGGVPTEVNEYPWQVAIVFTGSNSFICGGSVYNDRYILTAAHCANAINNAGYGVDVLLGANDLNSPTIAQQRITVSEIIKHPNFSLTNFDNDIALLKMSTSAVLNSRVKPACLPDPSANYDNVLTTVSGWGATSEGGPTTTILMETDVPTMPNSQCQQSYGTSAITSNMICAGLPAGGKNICQGDSGGPMVTNVNGVWVQIGITSFSHGCARPGYPGVYTRIALYLSWLASTAAAGTNSLCSSVPTSATTVAPAGCKCGIVNNFVRIVGGVQTSVNKYPWQVGLIMSTGTRSYCGGSIISDQWILTAAHCVVGKLPASVNVVIGEHDWSSTTETSATQRRTVSQILMNPDYNAATYDGDLALIKLSTPIIFPADNRIAPVCLPPLVELYDNVQANVTGWGTLTYGGVQPNQLYEVTIPTMSNSQCQSYYEASAITSNMLCAGLAEGGKDSCQGDSGGPLITFGNAANTYMVEIGIVSWGKQCALPNYPGVYTRVNNYLNWITGNIVGSSMCPHP